MSRRLLLLSMFLSACGTNFDPSSLVESVRILATSADKPYAAPGDTVHMNVLAFDGRASKPEPMKLYWLPTACIDPPGGNYYACYPAFAKMFKPNVDIGGQLTAGTSFSFQMPSDVIASNQGRTSVGDPYGLAVVFTIACAGHVVFLPTPAGASPAALPFGCLDSSGAALSPDDFVFAYTLIYSFTNRTNANPVIDAVTFGGTSVNVDAGITVGHCATSNCPSTSIGTVVPPSSQETDPGDLGANGQPLKEEIYVDYYVTAGSLKDDTVILYDPQSDSLSGADSYQAPTSAGDYLFWSVVHDNRGGTSWLQIPLHAQ